MLDGGLGEMSTGAEESRRGGVAAAARDGRSDQPVAIDRVELLRRAREVYSAREQSNDSVRGRGDRKEFLFRARNSKLAQIQGSRLNSLQPPCDSAAHEARKVAPAESLRTSLDEDIANVEERIERILACSPAFDHARTDEARKMVPPDPLRAALDEDISYVENRIDRILACSSDRGHSRTREVSASRQTSMLSTGSTMLAALEMEVAAVEATQMTASTD